MNKLSLSADPSKQEEIDFLEAITEIVPKNSYLSNLFTKPAVSWLRQQIRDDFVCDLYYNWQEAEKESAKRQDDLIDCMNERDADKVKYVESRQELMEALNNNDAEHRELVKRLHTEIETLATMRNEAQNNWDNAENQLRAANQKVMELKAKLYDLEHA